MLDALENRGSLKGFRKDDYFLGDPMNSWSRIMPHIDEILAELAAAGEFVTRVEWEDHYKGTRLQDMAGGCGKHLKILRGYMCNAHMQDLVPQTPACLERLDRPEIRKVADTPDHTLFWKSCARGDYEAARALWSRVYVSVDFLHAAEPKVDRYTPLIAAIINDYDKNGRRVAAFLLAAGADPDARTYRNVTPLRVAVQHGRMLAAKMLVDELAYRYRDDPVALYCALTATQKGESEQPWYRAGANGSAITAQYILKPQIEAQNQVLAMLPALLDNAPTPSDLLQHSERISPFALALKLGKVQEAVDALVKKGGRVTPRIMLESITGEGLTPLEMIATQEQLPELFTVKNCMHHVREMRECWKELTDTHKAQMDGRPGRPSFQDIIQTANQQAAKQRPDRGRG